MAAGDNIIWKDVETYCADAKVYWVNSVSDWEDLEKFLAETKIQTDLADLSSIYGTFKSDMASTGLNKLREWYIIPLFSYCTMISAMTGYPANLAIQKKFTSPSYGSSAASSSYDDLRNSVISWNYIDPTAGYTGLYTSASNVEALVDSDITNVTADVTTGYTKWDSYMGSFNTTFIQENCSIGIWGAYNPGDTISIGLDKPIWGSAPDVKSAVLSSSTFTVGPNNTTIQPMHFMEVMTEVGWSIVGLNDPAT